MQRHPATQENSGGYTGYDEQVQVLCQIEEAETHTGVFRMITGGQLAFGFGQVERAAVGFRITRNKIDDERYNCRDVSFEYKPAVGLSGYDFGELHRAHQDYHCQDTQPAGKFVTDDLRAASHGSDKRELVVGTPAGKQDTYHADT